MRFHDGNGDGDCLDAADNIRYYAGDANFNVTATIDAGTGAVVERYVYTAYGQATVYDGSWANPTAPTTDSPLYCGYFFDTETSLYQVRNRYYDLGLSTFVSRDPVGHAAGDLNLYRYCGRNVITSVDPVGEFPISTEDECECKHTVIALFKTNKHIEEYSGKFGSTCPRPQFFCENCDDDPDMYGQYVPGDPATKQAKKIRLCYNTLRGEDETLMVDTIIHEMVHALQDCYAWKNPFGRCASCYRNEIEANYCEPNGSKDFDALLAASSGSCWNDCLGKKLSFDQKHALKVWFKKHKGELCKFPR
jgi:RHS repeat-associated protein